MASWEKIIPRPRSTFMKVKCPECGNEQIIFSHSTMDINCRICNAKLAYATGGKIRVQGEVVDTLQ